MRTFFTGYRKYVVSILVLLYAAFGMLISQLPDAKFHIYFFDVGQGDSIFIKTPLNHQILIDGGPDDSCLSRLSDVMPFFDKSIDMIVLTHPHADHIAGLIEAIKRYDVDYVLLTGVSFDDPYYKEFLRHISDKTTRHPRVFVAEAGTDFLFSDVLVDVIYPFKSISGEKFKNVNNSSTAIRVTYSGKSVLLTGDLESEIEKELVLSGENLNADILKAGHHGSKTASSLEFLKKVLPERVVISCGADNKFGHPHAETLRNFGIANVKEILRTDISGGINFSW